MSDAVRATDAVVIGGGVIGCAIAFRLSQAGLSVSLIERGEPGGEASSAAAGILGAQMESHGPGPLLSLHLASRALHPALAAELLELTGIDVRCRIEGVLELAFSEEEAHELRTRFEWQRDAGLSVEWHHGAAMTSDFNHPASNRVDRIGASPSALAGLFCPRDGQVDNRQLARALRAAAEKSGVAILRGEADSIVAHAGHVSAVHLRGGPELSTPRAIVAAGSWSALVGGANISYDSVRPVRGQMLSLAADDLGSSRVLSCSTGYVVPRGDRALVGATVEETGYKKGTTPLGTDSLLATAVKLMPRLKHATILESWSGLRPASRDGLPLLGAPANGPEGLFVATGHYRSGILLTPITAEIVRAAVTGKPQLDLAPFRPDRFQAGV